MGSVAAQRTHTAPRATRGRAPPAALRLPEGMYEILPLVMILATAALGWEPVAGIWGASGESTTGHGVCAGDKSWVFGITTLSGPFASAAFHPNPAGQRSIGRQIARTLGLR